MSEQLAAWIERSLAGAPTRAFQARLREELERRTHAMTTTGIREGFTTITPYLAVADVERLIGFAKEVFGAEETLRSAGGSGGTHCEVRIGDSMLMLGGPAGGGREKPNALHVYLPGVDALYERALAAGAVAVAPPEDKPYGERLAAVEDPTGNVWYIATRREIHPDLRTVTPFLTRRNALGLIDFLKAAFGATEIGVFKTPSGDLLHGALKIGDAALEFGEGDSPGPAAFYLYVPDADTLYRQAVDAGAKPLYPPADQPYGDRVGGVEDKWGNTWYIASRLLGG